MNDYIQESTPEGQAILDKLILDIEACHLCPQNFIELIKYADKNAKRICLVNFEHIRLEIYKLYRYVNVISPGEFTVSYMKKLKLKYF